MQMQMQQLNTFPDANILKDVQLRFAWIKKSCGMKKKAKSLFHVEQNVNHLDGF